MYLQMNSSECWELGHSNPHFRNAINERNEFLLLFDAFRSETPNMPYDSYPEFNLDEMNEGECLAECQFKKVDIPLLAKAQILPVFECPQGKVSVIC